MFSRLLGCGVAATTAVVASFAFAAAPASADPSSTPDANAIVGVGSDTIEFVLNDLATGYNATLTGTSPAKLASWNATGPSGEQWSPRAGVTPGQYVRPNGSTAGKNALYGSTEIPSVNFARSSSAESTAEANAGLFSYPFAVDGLEAAVSGTVASHAPASISRAVLLKIYDGTYKQWKDIPGYTGSAPNNYIHPKVPQSGSGTRKFFEAQLIAERGGAATWAPTDYGQPSGAYPGVVEVQEHDPSTIMNDPDAIAPFSTARAHTLSTPSEIHLEDGWSAQRAVYDVVRQADIGSSWVAALFGSNGYLCSSAGRSIIEQNGFAQLASQGNGGSCGVPTQSATSNLSTNTVTTTTTLSAVSKAGHQATLTAVVNSGSTAADGEVDFFEGATQVGTGLLSGGQAVTTVSGLAAGAHTFTAQFASGNPAAFSNSTSSPASVTVKKTSTSVVSVASAIYGHAHAATVTVTDEGGAPSTGSVRLAVGSWSATSTLSNGVARFTVPGTIPAGPRTAVASYAGTSDVGGSTGTRAFGVSKSAVTLSESFPSVVAKRHRAVGVVHVALAPASAVHPTGTVVIKDGSRVISVASLSNGSRTITLPKLKKGLHHLTVVYGGSANTAARSLAFTIKQK